MLDSDGSITGMPEDSPPVHLTLCRLALVLNGVRLRGCSVRNAVADRAQTGHSHEPMFIIRKESHGLASSPSNNSMSTAFSPGHEAEMEITDETPHKGCFRRSHIGADRRLSFSRCYLQ